MGEETLQWQNWIHLSSKCWWVNQSKEKLPLGFVSSAPFRISPSLSVTVSTVGGTQIFKKKWWTDLVLQSTDPLIPENSKPTTDTNYVPVINDTFRVNTQKMTWNAAKSFCEKDGATLASLRNEWAKRYSHMMSLNLNAPLWIGLNRKAVWHRDLLITQSSITVNISSLSDKIGEANVRLLTLLTDRWIFQIYWRIPSHHNCLGSLRTKDQ